MIWQAFMELICKCTNVDTSVLTVNENSVILKMVHPKATHIVNLLVLIVKQHIYYCKCAQKSIIFREIMEKIENIYQMEMYNSKISFEMQKLQTKWAPYAGDTEIT